jgi:concanavalin A-like lectin/glucanase superfamily protein
MHPPVRIGARGVRRFKISLLPLSTLVLFGAASCGSEPPTPSDELQALLHDEPLTQVAGGALTTDGGMETGAGGSTGTDGGGPGTGMGGTNPVGKGGTFGGGGTTGFGGTMSPPDGGPGTGQGGTTGIAGRGMAGTIGTGVGGRGMAGSFGTAGTRGGPPMSGTLGRWSFDDCNTFRTNLFDNSGQRNDAFRSVSAMCAAGISNQGVALADKQEDIIYVPDQPSFTFVNGVTVAAWFNHTAISQTRTLFRKRDDSNSSAFALVLNNQKYEWVVNLGGTKAASVVSPKKAKIGEWTHVAASYDGNTLRLYVDGILVVAKGLTGAATSLVPAAGPFLMGNDGSKRLMAGRIDEALLVGNALSDQEIRALTCIRRQPTIVGTPAVSAPTPSGVPASYDITITNNDSPSCNAVDYSFRVDTFINGVTIQPTSEFVSQVPPGGIRHIGLTATASEDVDSGTFRIPFSLFPINGGQFAFGSVDFVVVASGCRVSTPRELMITSLGVVDDARTQGDGAWSFKHLMEAMAPTPADAPAMVEQMLSSFLTTQTINSFQAEPRLGFQFLLGSWPRTSDGNLDLSQPLVQLQAIVNRFDLRNLANGDAGEGRFVFAFVSSPPPFGFPFEATLILEYKLPASSPDEVLGWANAWHALGTMTPGNPDYNAALEAITERFAGRGVRTGHPNGSAINAVRTNEISFSSSNMIWELREFGLSSSTGMLVPATIKLTPDQSFNFTDTLASFINANEAAILSETHDVPEQFQGEPFLTGAVFNDFSTWNAPGINNSEARHKFGLNTCNGCHSTETGVGFLQIRPRFPFSGEASLSGFLTGTTVFDPVTYQQREFNDLARRRADLRMQVCPAEPMPPGPGPGPMMGGTGGAGGRATLTPSMRLGSLTRGLSRVH